MKFISVSILCKLNGEERNGKKRVQWKISHWKLWDSRGVQDDFGRDKALPETKFVVVTPRRITEQDAKICRRMRTNWYLFSVTPDLHVCTRIRYFQYRINHIYKWSTTRFSLNCTHPLVGISGYVRGRLDSWERGLGLWVSSWKKSGDDDDTGVVCRQGSIDVPWKGVYSTWSRVGLYACPLYAFMRIMWVSGRGETDAVGWEGEADGGVYRVWVEVRGM